MNAERAAEIASLRAELRAVKQPRSHAERQKNREAMLAAAVARPEMTIAELSEQFGFAPSSLPAYLWRAGISLRGRGLVPARRPLSDRAAAIVEAYYSGRTFRSVGDEFGISHERVRQLVVRHESLSGAEKKRTGRQYPSRTAWRCDLCGCEKHLTATQLAKAGTRCPRCRRTDVEKAERFIAAYRENPNWLAIANAAGSQPNNAARLVYHYLLRRRDAVRPAELWPRGVPAWLINIHGELQEAA